MAAPAVICGRFCRNRRDDPGVAAVLKAMHTKVLTGELALEALTSNRLECHGCSPQRWLSNPACPGVTHANVSFISIEVIASILVLSSRKDVRTRAFLGKGAKIYNHKSLARLFSSIPREHLVTLSRLFVSPAVCHATVCSAFRAEVLARQRAFSYHDVARLISYGYIERPVVKAAQCCSGRSMNSADAQAVHALREYFGNHVRLSLTHPAAPRLLRAIKAVQQKFFVPEELWRLVLAHIFVI